MSSRLILASGSPYRRELLQRLQLPFEVRASKTDEAPRAGENPLELAQRLARSKADVVARENQDAWVIGSDQLAVLAGKILGKPGNAQRCIEMLRDASGQTVEFLTAVHVTSVEARRSESHVDSTVVRFRKLELGEIQRYVEREPAFDCAGGFKAEGLGITLFDGIESLDPTALIGLPMIWVAGALRRAGFG